jgi:transposase
MAKRVRDGGKEQYWRQVLARWRSSGLSVRDYCELHRISQPSLYWWRREIPRRDGARPQFLPVRVVAEAVASNGDSDAIEVVLANQRCLRVRPGFDRATLVRLLDVLEDGGTAC